MLATDGSNFVAMGDLGLALGFALSGSSATVIINDDTQPLPAGVAGTARLVQGSRSSARW